MYLYYWHLFLFPRQKNRRLYQKIFLFYICFEDFVMLVQLVFAHFATSGCKLLAVPFYAQSWPSLLLLPTFVRKERRNENLTFQKLLCLLIFFSKKIWAQNIVFCHYVSERDKKNCKKANPPFVPLPFETMFMALMLIISRRQDI